MTKPTKKQVEKAIQEWKCIKVAQGMQASKLAEQEEIIEAYAREHLGDFVDNQLAFESGTIAIKAGAAKPMKNGKPLSTAARAELAVLLPPAYVKQSCEFAALYGVEDKKVREMLKSRGIEIVRDDKYVVL